MLRTAAPGTYLVRFSNSSRNSYCISSVSRDKKVKHTTIPNEAKGVTISGNTYSNICELIQIEGPKRHLTIPAPNSKFAWLYGDDVASVEGYNVE